MKVGFFLYNVDVEGMFKSYYTIGALDSKALILDDDVKYKDIIFDVLNELRLTTDNPRVLFLGDLNVDMFTPNDVDNDIDIISVDVSGLPIKNFVENYNLVEKTAYMIKRENNSILLSMFIKTLILRNQLAINEKDKMNDAKMNSAKPDNTKPNDGKSDNTKSNNAKINNSKPDNTKHNIKNKSNGGKIK